MAQERGGVIASKGNLLTLVGTPVEVGQKAPDFKLAKSLTEFQRLSDSNGKTRILNIVPSLDTSVCDAQTRKLNEHAGKLGDQVAVLTISMDLPPAQARWCGIAEAKNITCLSDYKDHSFGQSYGLYIKELGLLARAIIVLDRDGMIRYQQIVPEVASEPNYDDVLEAVKRLL